MLVQRDGVNVLAGQMAFDEFGARAMLEPDIVSMDLPDAAPGRADRPLRPFSPPSAVHSRSGNVDASHHGHSGPLDSGCGVGFGQTVIPGIVGVAGGQLSTSAGFVIAGSAIRFHPTTVPKTCQRHP